MAIYKQKVGVKRADFWSGVCWALYGFMSGVYCIQPVLKTTHREENSIVYDYVKKWDEADKAKQAEKQKQIAEQKQLAEMMKK